MQQKSQRTLLAALIKLFCNLTPRRKIQLIWVMLLMLVGAIAELMTLGSIMPLLAVMADPTSAISHPYLRQAFGFLGWTDPNKFLFPLVILFGVTVLFAGIVRMVIIWVTQKYVFRVGYDLSVEVYRRTLYQDYEYHTTKNSGELIAGVGKVQNIVGSVIRPLMDIAMSLIITVFIFSALLVIDTMVALTAAGGFTLIYLGITCLTRKKLSANSQLMASAQNERIKTMQEGYGGIRDIIIDQAQPTYVNHYGRVDLVLRNAQMINAFIGLSPYYAIQALAMILIAGLAYTISITYGGLTAALPVLGALALGAQRLMPMLQLIYRSITQIIGHQQVLQDVIDFLELPLSHNEKNARNCEPLPFNNSIQLKDLNFHYSKSGPDILNNTNLVINKGTKVGFIGKTGSGKSTLIDLIMGLLSPSSGVITVDGETLTGNNISRFQKRIAHVPQSIYLTDTTIAENIAFGVHPDNIDFDQVKEAAHRAQISEYIENLDNGYNTDIGERGVRLSGGQRQRIGIARALYKKADILIFDEATSALDTETEEAVMREIYSLDGDLTILIIAHRLTTIQHCDKVIKLELGSIFAEGSLNNINNIPDSNTACISEKAELHAN